jgi:hypothetical protein
MLRRSIESRSSGVLALPYQAAGLFVYRPGACYTDDRTGFYDADEAIWHLGTGWVLYAMDFVRDAISGAHSLSNAAVTGLLNVCWLASQLSKIKYIWKSLFFGDQICKSISSSPPI